MTIAVEHLMLLAIIVAAIYFGAKAARTGALKRMLTAAEQQRDLFQDKILVLRGDLDDLVIRKNQAERELTLDKKLTSKTAKAVIKANAIVAGAYVNRARGKVNNADSRVDDAILMTDEIKAQKADDQEFFKTLLDQRRTETMKVVDVLSKVADNAVNKAGKAVGSAASKVGDASVTINNITNGEGDTEA